MYKEETLVLTETKKEQPVQKDIVTQKSLPKKSTEKKQPTISSKNYKASFKEKKSSVVEKPNYDFIESLTPEKEEKIFKIEKEYVHKNSKFNIKKMRLTLFSLIVAVLTIWGIVNVANIDSIQHSYNILHEEYYNINLPNYLKNLGQLDAVNKSNMDNLFETIPEEPVSPTSIESKTNWFDRICEFLVGLFGG